MKRFDGRVALITGGGSGLGLACARALVQGGAHVMLAARREDVLRAACADLGGSSDFVRCDVTDDASVEDAVAATRERFGPLSLAVNAAGAASLGSVLNSTSAELATTLETNLVGVFRCVRAEARAMLAQGGSIVNVSSIAGELTHRWMTAYCISKAGVNMLTRCAADDLGERGIRVNAVMPGLVPTDLAAPLSGNPEAVAEYERCMPQARLGRAEEVAETVAFLLSDEAGWITGQCLAVDGGHTIRKGPDLVPLFRQILPEER